MRIIFSSRAWSEYLFWQENDLKILRRINEIIREIARSPFVGIGRPEPLRYEMAGFWSRRIDMEHRLVYRVSGKRADQSIEIASCRFHYDG